MIPGDDSQIRHQPPKEVPPPPKGTGKLEILNDQYGLTDPEAPAGQHKSQVHDYDWFINAVREEDGAQSTTQQGGDEASPGPSDSGKLSFTNPAALVDPVTPGPAPVSPEATPAGASGVEKFIDEFKKEVEQLRSTEPDDLAGVEQKQLGTAPVEEMTWEEKLETITSEQVGLFTRELAQEVGRKVAELIATKIDSEKLMHLIKEELIKHCRRNP